MQFEQRTIEVSRDNERQWLEVSLAPGTGLAYHHRENCYDVLHVQTGCTISSAWVTEWETQAFIEQLCSLTDWNQSREELNDPQSSLFQQVDEVRAGISNETDAMLRRCLDDEVVKRLDDYQRRHLMHTTLQSLLGYTLLNALKEATDKEQADDEWDGEDWEGDESEQDEDDQLVSSFYQHVRAELERACEKHPPLHSLHEAFAVLLEEVDEFKAEVWKQTSQRDVTNMRRELVQIAAMCARVVHDGLVS
jgi:hypothetical protein